MKTGRYRVRLGLFGKAILQYESNTPSVDASGVDASRRIYSWHDCKFSRAPAMLKEVKK